MALRLDPRGDLPLPTIQHMSYIHSHSAALSDTKRNTRRLSSLSLSTKPRQKPCYDWILSTATNVHVALDRSAFKEYTSFNSYVLTLADYRQVQVEGVGCVELKIRRKPDSKESHVIVLNNVLHIPSWFCNILSDIYFNPGHDFEHSWNDLGVQFSVREDGELQPWGYTENFFTFDRLILAKRHKDSKSPMLEDKDREIFSINITWPQSQRDRWDKFLARHQSPRLSRVISAPGLSIIKTPSREALHEYARSTMEKATVSRRATLSNMNANIIRSVPKQKKG